MARHSLGIRTLHPSRFARSEAQFAQQINVNTGRPRGSGITVGPRIHDSAAELAAVVHGNRFGIAALGGRGIQRMGDLSRCQRVGRFQDRAFPSVLIHHRQRPEVSPVLQPVGDKVH